MTFVRLARSNNDWVVLKDWRLVKEDSKWIETSENSRGPTEDKVCKASVAKASFFPKESLTALFRLLNTFVNNFSFANSFFDFCNSNHLLVGSDMNQAHALCYTSNNA